MSENKSSVSLPWIFKELGLGRGLVAPAPGTWNIQNGQWLGLQCADSISPGAA